jgi:hypothetical protein
MKLIKLIVVLLFAAMILALGLLIASVSGCAPIASTTTLQATPSGGMFVVLGTSITFMLASIWISARSQGYQRTYFVALMLLAFCGVVVASVLILIGVNVP